MQSACTPTVGKQGYIRCRSDLIISLIDTSSPLFAAPALPPPLPPPPPLLATSLSVPLLVPSLPYTNTNIQIRVGPLCASRLPIKPNLNSNRIKTMIQSMAAVDLERGERSAATFETGSRRFVDACPNCRTCSLSKSSITPLKTRHYNTHACHQRLCPACKHISKESQVNTLRIYLHHTISMHANGTCGHIQGYTHGKK